MVSTVGTKTAKDTKETLLFGACALAAILVAFTCLTCKLNLRNNLAVFNTNSDTLLPGFSFNSQGNF